MIRKCIFLDKGGTFFLTKTNKIRTFIRVATFFVALCFSAFIAPQEAMALLSVNGYSAVGYYEVIPSTNSTNPWEVTVNFLGASPTGASFRIEAGVVTIMEDRYYAITSDGNVNTNQRISVNTGVNANIRLTNVVINTTTLGSGDCAFSINGTAAVELSLSGTNSLTSRAATAGLYVPDNATVVINGPGSLTVTGGTGTGSLGGGAGIGGNGTSGTTGATGRSGTITINGGTITVNGGLAGTSANTGSGAGIGGGGSQGNPGTGGSVEGRITINGGTIYANGGLTQGSGSGGGAGAGIGGGGAGHNNGSGGSNNGGIYINGGTIYATGGSSNNGSGGAGIGGGAANESANGGKGYYPENIVINEYNYPDNQDGSTVIAVGGTGGNGGGNGPGIGDGGQTTASSVVQTIAFEQHPESREVVEGYTYGVRLSVRVTVTSVPAGFTSASYEWRQVTGPGTYTIVQAASGLPYFDLPSNLTADGTNSKEYQYYCYVRTANLATATNCPYQCSEIATITVLPAWNASPAITATPGTFRPYATPPLGYPDAYVLIDVTNEGNIPFMSPSTNLVVTFTNNEFTLDGGSTEGTSQFLNATEIPDIGLGVNYDRGQITLVAVPQSAIGTYTTTCQISYAASPSTILASFPITMRVVDKFAKEINLINPAKWEYLEMVEKLDLSALNVELVYQEDSDGTQEFSYSEFAGKGITLTYDSPTGPTVTNDVDLDYSTYNNRRIFVNYTGANGLISLEVGQLQIIQTWLVTIINGTFTDAPYTGLSEARFPKDEEEPPIPINFISEDKIGDNLWFSYWTHNADDDPQIGFVNKIPPTTPGIGEGSVKMINGVPITVTAYFKKLYGVSYDVEQVADEGVNGTIKPKENSGVIITNGERVIEGEPVTFVATLKTPLNEGDPEYTIREWKVYRDDVLVLTTKGVQGMLEFTVPGSYVTGEFDELKVTVSFRNQQTLLVTFAIGEGFDDIQDVPFLVNEKIIVPPPYPELPGKYIEEWYYEYEDENENPVIKEWNFDDQVNVLAQDILDDGYLTLTAKWVDKEENTWVVTFIAEGGEPYMTVQIIEDGGFLEPPIPYPVRDGFYLDNTYSWSTNPNDNPNPPQSGHGFYNFVNPTPVDKDMTLYARWIPKESNKVVITYIASNGKPIVQNAIINAGETAPFPDNSSEHGIMMPQYLLPPVNDYTKYVYTWREYDPSTETFLSDDEYNFALPVNKDLYLYADWQEIHVNDVVYILVALGVHDEGDGNGEQPKQMTYRYFAKRDGTFFDGTEDNGPNSLPDVLLSGYALQGWYTQPCKDDDTGPWCDCSISREWVFTLPFDDQEGDEGIITQILYAGWKKIKDTEVAVYFYSPDADNTTFQLVLATRDEPVDFSQVAPVTRKDFALTGWYEETEDGLAIWPVTKLVQPLNEQGGAARSMKLYAGWEPREDDKYFVTFQSNWGVPAFMPIQQVEGGNFAEMPPLPTRDGYVFSGWFKGLKADCTDDCTPGNIWEFAKDVVSQDTVLWAGWQKRNTDEFFITFIAEGAEPSYSIKKVMENEIFKISEAPMPVMAGYVLSYWSRDNNKDNPNRLPELFTSPINADMTVYAVWEEIPEDYDWLVRFFADGGNPPLKNQWVKNDERATYEIATKTGYYLEGWYTDVDCTSSNKWDFDDPVNDNIDLYAKFVLLPTDGAIVTFIAEGATPSITQIDTYKIGDRIFEPTLIAIPANTKLEGWYTTSSFTSGTKWDFINRTIAGSNLTLWANFVELEDNEITVTFIAEGAEPEWSQQVVLENEKVTPPLLTKYPDGKKLRGWNENMDESDDTTDWDFDEPVTVSMTLYAQWEDIPPTSAIVLFIARYGEPESSELEAEIGETISPPVPYPARDGYYIEGWYKTEGSYTNDTGWTDKWDFDVDVVEGNTTLFARWAENEENMIVVTFIAEGGVPAFQQTEPFAAGSPIVLPAGFEMFPTKEDFAISGWYDVPEPDESSTRWDFSKPVDDNMTLYAGWTAIDVSTQYAVTFIANGGIWDVQTVDKNDKVVMPDPLPTQTGMELQFWNKENEATPYLFSTPVTESFILEAHFINIPTGPPVYKVTFMVDDGLWDVKFVTYNSVVEEAVRPVPHDFDARIFSGWYEAPRAPSAYGWFFEEDKVEHDLVLEAGWELFTDRANEWAVTFIVGEQVSIWKVEIVANNGNATEPTGDGIPSKTNYTFEHWYTTTFMVDYDFAATPVTKDLNLYAYFQRLVSTVHYIVEGSEVLTEEINRGERAPIPEALFGTTKTVGTDDYILDGWYLDAECDDAACDDSKLWVFATPVDVQDLYLYAGWKLIDPTITELVIVTFVAEDGDPTLITKQVEKGTPVERPIDDAGNIIPVRDGYILEGWYESIDAEGAGVNQWNFDDNVDDDMTLYAAWKARQYGFFSVTFVMNDGTTAQTIVQVPEGEPVSKPTPPVYEGYVFTGWYTELACVNFWNFGDPVTRDIYLYAGWEPRLENHFAVTFLTNDGTTEQFIVQVPENEPIPANEVPDVSFAGHAFTGWFDEIGDYWNLNDDVTRDMTLTAGWKPITPGYFVVTFYANGGTFEDDVEYISVDVSEGDPIEPPADPERSGFAFIGWFKEYTCDNRWNFNDDVNESMILYAGWEEIPTDKFIVTFDANGGTIEGKEYILRDVPAGDPIEPPADPERSGFAFIGWFKEYTCLNRWNFNDNVIGNMILYAGWQEITPGSFVVTFDANGGTIEGEEYITVEVPENTPVTRPVDPVREGFAFIGWFKEYTCENIWVFGDDVTENMILYAGWRPRNLGEFIVTFDANGGKFGTEDYIISTVRFGTTPIPVAYPDSDPVRDGYAFVGWFKEYTCENRWNFNDNVTGNMILFAGWKEVEEGYFVVTFDANGGKFGTDEYYTVKVEEDSPVGYPTIDPERAEYAFTGWFTEPSCLSHWSFGNNVTDNMILYAGWEKIPDNQFVVTFAANGGKFADDTNFLIVYVDENSPVARPVNDPVRDGYAFIGWFTENTCDNNWNFNDNVDDNMILFAGWEEVPEGMFLVTFIANGGMFGTEDHIIVYVDQNEPFVTPPYPDPERGDDYAFIGWFTEYTCVNHWNFNDEVTKNMILYAGWEEVEGGKFVVTFNANGGKFGNDDYITEQVLENTPVDRPYPDPTRDGYAFIGWFKEYTCVNMWNFKDDVNNHLMLYAGWQEIPEGMFIVTFNAMGGKIEAKDYITVPVNVNTPIARPYPDPVRDGFAFIGWFKEFACLNQWNFLDDVTESMTLFAGWQEVPEGMFIVTFNAMGGKIEAKDYITVPVNVNTPVARPYPDPVRDGFAFIGWFKEYACLNQWNFLDDVTENMTLFAGWEEVPEGMFIVTFNAMGGKIEAKDYITVQVPENTPVTRPYPDPVRDGFAFIGWFKEFACLNPWNFLDDVTDNMTLFAGWQEVPQGMFIVTFDAMGGKLGTLDYITVQVPENTTVARPADPVRNGYVFMGWFKENVWVNRWNFDDIVTGNMTLFAGWMERQPYNFAVTFVLNDGTADQFIVQVPENTPVEKPANPVRDGYLFTDWYTEASCENLWDFAANVTGDMSLYAHWGPEDYNVFVVIDGGAPTLLGRFKEGETVDISAGVAPPNKRFDKWEANPDVVFAATTGSTKAITSFTMPASDVTVKAIFMEALDFDTYAVTKWNNTFMLNMTKLKAAGYDVTTCNWYKNDVLIHTGLSYYSKDSQLELNVPYYFELTMSNQSKKYSTDKVLTAYKSLELIAYPNPVVSGNMLTVEGVEAGSPVEVFNQIGTRVHYTIADDGFVTFSLNVPAGLYIIRTTNGEIKVIINN